MQAPPTRIHLSPRDPRAESVLAREQSRVMGAIGVKVYGWTITVCERCGCEQHDSPLHESCEHRWIAIDVVPANPALRVPAELTWPAHKHA